MNTILDYVVPAFAICAFLWSFVQLILEWPPRKERRNLRRMKAHAGQILRWVVDGRSTGQELELSDILMVGINPGFHHMAAVYFSLIQSLDHDTRTRIIDRVIEHGSNRCFGGGAVPDLAQCLGALNKVESETIIMCMTNVSPPVVAYVSRHHLKYDPSKFANEVIAFRLANP